MIKKQLQKIERELLREKSRILKQKGFTEGLIKRPQKELGGDLSSYATHPGDQGTDSAHREVASALTSQESELLVQIDQALQKIREGRYGICEECGESISEARLMALPYVRLCIKCKMEEDKGLTP